MISKSQFVIFSALLAYQGMVGAPSRSPSLSGEPAQKKLRRQRGDEEPAAVVQGLVQQVAAVNERAGNPQRAIAEHADRKKEPEAVEAKSKADVLAKINDLRRKVADAASDLKCKIEIAKNAETEAVAKAVAADRAKLFERDQARRHNNLFYSGDSQAQLATAPQWSLEHDAIIIQIQYSAALLQSAVGDAARAVEKANEAAVTFNFAIAAVQEAELVTKKWAQKLEELLRQNKDILDDDAAKPAGSFGPAVSADV